jgi:hypothetical protein
VKVNGKIKRPKRLLAMAVILLAGLYVTDHLFLQRRGIASFEGAANVSESASLFDLTDLPEKEFLRSFKGALVRGLQTHRENGALGLAWGQFLVRNAGGAKVYACEKYPTFEMTLKAEGVAYSGNTPTLTLRGPCLSSDDGQKILPLMVPLKGLFKNLRTEAVNRIPIGDRGDAFMLSAQYLYTEWPQYWNVTEVKMYSDVESLSLDGFEIISLLDQPLTLDFAEAQ